ncbi:YceD family protein [Sinomonas susongensis]|uniref:YceD family protein n=1 Tax=Sinomonas susongensis TaxID=1324851 RepID=UPI001109BAA8|nr:YceD family protein [Sinomonas susongensis]
MTLDVKDLGRSPGTMRTLEEHVPAPSELGVALIGVREGSPVDLDLRLESVHEGILVSGTAHVDVSGECGRCLDPIEYGLTVDVQELFSFEGGEPSDGEDDEEQRRVEHDSIDLEPVLRDAVVTMLPFQPVCREDCPGLCPECGIRLADEPGHHHEVVDPRWSALADLIKPDRHSDD